MAYTNTSALSVFGTYGVITTHMLANGWTLHDTLTDSDKVFKSTGGDGKQNHVIRLTIEAKVLTLTGIVGGPFTVGETVTGGTTAITARVVSVSGNDLGLIEVIGGTMFQVSEVVTGGTSGATGTVRGRTSSPVVAGTQAGFAYDTFKGPNDVHNAMDFVNVRAYRFWDAGTNTGVGETGQFGPSILAGFSGVNNTNGTISFARPKTAVFAPYDEVDALAYGNCFSAWDGIRRVFGNMNNTTAPLVGGSNAFYSVDLANADTTSWATPGIAAQETSGIPVWDRVNDLFFVYTIFATATLANQWKRWNSNTNLWEALAAPPVDHSSRACGYAWDGGRYIYVMSMSSTAFSRYDIQTNSWTAMAVVTLGDATTNYTGFLGMYIPAGTIPGVTEDVIYFKRNYNSTIMHRYNVASNTWSGAVNFPETPDNSSSITWDQTRYVYYYPGRYFTYCWRLDLQNIGGGWSSIAFPARSGGPQPHVLNQYVCKLHPGIGVTNEVVILGDADSIVCSVRNTVSGKNYWTSFGRIDSYYNNYAQVMSAPAVVGVPTTVNVPTTTGIAAGASITVLDPATGNLESVNVIQVLSGTQFTCSARLAYTTGSLVFVDYANTILTGDSWFALATFDSKGFEGDGQASNYRIKPLAAVEFTTRSGVNVRGAVQVFPYVVYNLVSTLGTFENRGTVRFVYTCRTGGTVQVGDIIQDAAGNQYRVFNVEFTRLTNDNRLLAIGPIN